MNNLHLRNLPVPFLSQRKNEYVWKSYYAIDEAKSLGKPELVDKIKEQYSMACNSCNITSIAMVLQYFGITKDTPDTMMRRYFDRKNEKDKDVLKDLSTVVSALEVWKNLEQLITVFYGEKVKELYGTKAAEKFVTYYNADAKESVNSALTMEEIRSSIAAGYPVIANNGVLAKDGTKGHIVVIRGFTEIKGREYIILNDPWGVPVNVSGNLKNSGSVRGYYFDELGAGFSKYYGGTGDNCIMETKKFETLIKEGKSVESALIVRSPLWNFPDGSVVKENNSEIYAKEILCGGGFPIKANSLWHNGIHLNTGGDVYAVGAGRLVAVRNEINPPATGDSSFVLLRHEFENKKKERIDSFYCLYMHLRPLDIKAYAQELFEKGSCAQKVQWPLQLLRQLLPLQYVVFNGGNNTPDTSGLINEKFKKIDVFNAECSDGVFYKKEKSSLTLGQRMLIHPLPANNQRLYKKLLDPSSYSDDDFLEGMKNKSNFEKKINGTSFIFFYYHNRLVCVEVGSFLQTKALVNKQQFEYTAKRIHELAAGKIVSFTDPKPPDTDMMVETAVLNIYKNCWERPLFDTYRMAQYEKWKTNYTNIKNNMEKDFKVTKNEDASLFLNILRYIYTLNEGNTIAEVTNKIATILADVAKKYGQSRVKEIRRYLEALLQVNKNKESANKKAGKQSEKSASAQKSMYYVREFCKKIIEHINAEYGVRLTAAALLEKPNGTQVIEEFMRQIKGTNEEVTPLVQKYAIENVVIGLMRLPLEVIALNNGKEDYFTLDDGSINTLLKEYAKIFELIGKQYTDSLSVHYVDPFIEIKKEEVLGNCGKYISSMRDKSDKELIHFEIFSEKEILDIETAKQVIDDDKDAYFNPVHCVEKIKTIIPQDYKSQLKCLKDNLLTKDEINDFYTNLPQIREIACNHVSKWAQLDWKKIINNSAYVNKEIKIYNKLEKVYENLKKEEYVTKYHTPYMWMDKKIFDKQGSLFQDNKAWFYHPIRFLELISARS